MLAWKPKSSNTNIASVRYRCLLPVEKLKKRGFPVELYAENNLSAYSGVVFSKLYDQKHQRLAEKLKEGGKKVILDICDNHFYNPYGLPEYVKARKNILRMLELADQVICSTEALAKVVQEEAHLAVMPSVVGDPIEVLPEPIDKDKRRLGLLHRMLGRTKRRVSLPVLLWYGNHGSPNAQTGMLDLIAIRKILEQVYKESPFELVVASNSRSKFEQHISHFAVPKRYVEWGYQTFGNLLRTASGVLIPITRNPFTLCKTNNRLTMSLCYGIPVVADSIPSYQEFESYSFLDDWDEGLRVILTDRERAEIMANEGRAYVLKHWGHDPVIRRWEEVLSHFLAS